MPSFYAMVKAQKVMWVKRLLDNNPRKWKVFSFKLMGLSKSDLLFKNSYEYIPSQSPFYSQTLKYWYELYSTEPEPEYICNEVLWKNKFILIENEPVQTKFKHWQNHGIQTISNIIHPNGIFLTRQQLEVKYNLHIAAIEYMSIVDAIPTHWKFSMKTNNQSLLHMTNHSIVLDNNCYNIDTISNKMVYNIFVKRIFKTPTALHKWIDQFPFLNDNDFGNFFTLAKKIVKDIKLQVFQYKILNRILATEENNFKWGLSENGQCSRCGEIESIEHLLYYCSHTKTFWKRVENWITCTFDIKLSFSVTDVLFGIPSINDATFIYINFVILHAKWYLYKSKLGGDDVFLLTFLPILKNAVYLEYYTESLKCITENENRWNDLLQSL